MNLSKGLKKMTQLKLLNLNLFDNDLGVDEYDMMYLKEILEKLINLEHLEIILSGNDLG